MTINGPTCRYNNGEEVIKEFGMDGSSIAADAIIVLAFYVGFRILSFLVLHWRARKQATAA